ncbi:MAG TPA: hypothetical protein VIJ16_04810 [Gemmatimonadaceae bacterium]
MKKSRLAAGFVLIAALSACAPARNSGTTPSPVSSLGGTAFGVPLVGTLVAAPSTNTGTLTASRAARVDGTVRVTPTDEYGDQFSVDININSQRGAETLLWSIVEGPCLSGGMALVPPRQLAHIDVRDSGQGRVHAEFRAALTMGTEYHLNLYANGGSGLEDVVACARLKN